MAAHIHSQPLIFETVSGEPILVWKCLDLLLILAERLDFIEGLPRPDLEVIFPDPGHECPVCYKPYRLDNLPSDEGPDDIIALQLPCKHILCWTCVHALLQVHHPGSIPCPFCRAQISTTPTAEFDFRPEIRIIPDPWTMLYHAIKTYMAIYPDAESMDELIAWVQDLSRFRADVTDDRLRRMVELVVIEWEIGGSLAMWELYFSAMGKDIDDEVDDEVEEEVDEETDEDVDEEVNDELYEEVNEE